MVFCSQVLLFAQENPEDIVLAEDKTENNFYESVKLRAIENYDKAIVAIEKCIQSDNTNPVFYHELGKNYLDLKQYPQAEQAFQKAVDLNPKERWYWNGLYDVYYQTKEYQKAIDYYNQIMDHHADGIYVDEALFFSAEIYRKYLDDAEKAKPLYEKMIFEHADSIYFAEARKQFRILRGDANL